eukprot:7036371-Pyramimonas_sp.AAC.1
MRPCRVVGAHCSTPRLIVVFAISKVMGFGESSRVSAAALRTCEGFDVATTMQSGEMTPRFSSMDSSLRDVGVA